MQFGMYIKSIIKYKYKEYTLLIQWLFSLQILDHRLGILEHNLFIPAPDKSGLIELMFLQPSQPIRVMLS